MIGVTALDRLYVAADNSMVSSQTPSRGSTIDLAALAFSLLSTKSAEDVNRRLNIVERSRLREGLARVRDASDEERQAAIRALASAIRTGVDWPRPASHDEADCPFSTISQHERSRVVEVLERVAIRDPIEVVVTLCHLNPAMRTELWERVSSDTRILLLPRLQEVHLVSVTKTREYARDINTRLKGAIRASTSRRPTPR